MFSSRFIPAAWMAASILLSSSCASFPSSSIPPASETRLPAFAVICGLSRVDPSAYGGWSGDCPGTDVDCSCMADAMRHFGIPYISLFDRSATISNVLASCSSAASRLSQDGLLILYFSGHGGQVVDPSDVSEIDGKSETICLFDGELLDNQIWDSLQKLPSSVRVFLDTDCCNSGTNYRAKHNFRKAVPRGTWRGSMLAVGGCADGKASFGSAQGGALTTAQIDAMDFARPQSWREWIGAFSSLMPGRQVPSVSVLGGFNMGGEIFK